MGESRRCEPRILSELLTGWPWIFTDITKLQSDLAELQSDKSELQSDVAKLLANITELQPHVTELQPDISELQSDITEVLTDKSVLFTDESKLQSNVTQLQSHVTVVFTLLASLHPIEPQVQPDLQSFVPIILTGFSKIHRWRWWNTWIKGVLSNFTHLFTI